MAERKVRKTAGKTAANTTKRTATKTTAKTAAKRTTRTKAAAKEDFRIGELDQYLFSMGTHYDIYKKMGAHEAVMNGKKGVYFAVWAPNAATVSVIGEFNGWREEANPMTRLEPSGIYEGFVVGAKEGMLYKFFTKQKMAEDFTKPIRLQIMQSSVREPHPGSQISRNSDGVMRRGWKQESREIMTAFRFLFMKYIRVPGRNIRMERTRMDSIITESLQNHLQNM